MYVVLKEAFEIKSQSQEQWKPSILHFEICWQHQFNSISLQIIAFSLVLNCVQGKLVEVSFIPDSLANPDDVSTNFKQCNQIAFPPTGTTSDITDLGDLSDKDLTQKPIFFSGYGFTKLDT